MTSWIDPASGKAPLFGGADVVTAATPLAMMKGGEFAEVTAQYSLSDMFIGNIGGSLGEISAMMLLIGGLYLISARSSPGRSPLPTSARWQSSRSSSPRATMR